MNLEVQHICDQSYREINILCAQEMVNTVCIYSPSLFLYISDRLRQNGIVGDQQITSYFLSSFFLSLPHCLSTLHYVCFSVLSVMTLFSESTNWINAHEFIDLIISKHNVAVTKKKQNKTLKQFSN